MLLYIKPFLTLLWKTVAKYNLNHWNCGFDSQCDRGQSILLS